jgi:hypothetical protein
MRPTARNRANRRNAKRSTGPQTPAGKARASKNALQHGLTIPVTLDIGAEERIDRLAELIAGSGADAARSEHARRIAEAQIDLCRVQLARLSVLRDHMSNLTAQTNAGPVHEMDFMWQPPPIENVSGAPGDRFDLIIDDAIAPAPLQTLIFLVRQLELFDRYERRALSRRQTAIRDYYA